MKNYRTSKQVLLAFVTVFPPAILTMEAGHPLQESPIYPFFRNHVSVANPSVQRNKIILKVMGTFSTKLMILGVIHHCWRMSTIFVGGYWGYHYFLMIFRQPWVIPSFQLTSCGISLAQKSTKRPVSGVKSMGASPGVRWHADPNGWSTYTPTPPLWGETNGYL